MDMSTAFRFMEQTTPMETEQQPTPEMMQSTYSGITSRPVLYNIDGYISPYPSNNWNINAPIFSNLDDESRFPGLETKLDPNKIFSSDLSALKSLASDQLKIKKMFEKNLKESLTERGKVGLTEEEILAMQAVTSACSAITAIQKEISSIKKNTAELRLKQQQQQQALAQKASMSGQNGETPLPTSNMGIGRSILDDIFAAHGAPVDTSAPMIMSDSIPEVDISRADQLLDELIPSVDPHTQYEHLNPTTYVMVGETDDDVEYATYAENGDLLPDYPNPTSTVAKIDRDARTAQDDLMEKYPIKFKNET